MAVPAAPASLFAVILQGIVVFRHIHGSLGGLMAHHRSAQIGVQHDAGAVDHRPQAHAAVFLHLLQHRPGHPFQGQIRLFTPEDLLPQAVQHLAHPIGHLAASLFHGFFHLRLGQHLVHLGDRTQQFFFDLHLYLILSFENSSSRPKGGHSALIIHHPQALPQGRGNRKKGRTCRPFFYSA